MNRKAQAQIITTVLIILLVLAAIVIVWQVVSSSITEGAEDIPGQSSCLTFEFDMTGVTDETTPTADTITIKRGARGDTSNFQGFRVYKKSTADTQFTYVARVFTSGGTVDTVPETHQSTTYDVRNIADDADYSDLVVTDKVKIAAVFGDDFTNGNICDFMGVSATGGLTAA